MVLHVLAEQERRVRLANHELLKCAATYLAIAIGDWLQTEARYLA